MNDTALISILMGVYYRRPDTTPLERSVRSILEQTTPAFELLICDDGSSDAASALLDELSRQDSRIRLIRPGGVFPLPNKLNVCLRQARGAWIGRMDDDDCAHPDRLEKQLDYLERHPDISFVGCNVDLIRGGQPAGQWRFPELPTVEDFYIRQPYVHPTLLFRRCALEAVGGYSEGKRQVLCEDYDLLLRLYEKGFRGANLQECLFDYTLPETAKGSRRMRHRWNEVVTRFQRFRALGRLPKALPYVVKPIVVGLLPEKILEKVKGR